MILDVEFIENVQDFDVEFGENIENTTELEAQIKTLNAQIAELEQYATEAYEAGKQAENIKFWNGQTVNGNRTNFDYAFYGEGWNDDTFKLPYTIQPTRAGYMFKGCRITKSEHLKKLNFSGCANFVQTFMESSIEELGIIDTSNAGAGFGGLNQTFMYCQNLKKIEKVILPKTPMRIDGFGYCSSLTEIRFEGTAYSGFDLQWSTQLSKASIISIINALSTTTSGLSVTLSKNAVNKAFETSNGANDGSTSAEWLALVATKSNWTVALA